MFIITQRERLVIKGVCSLMDRMDNGAYITGEEFHEIHAALKEAINNLDRQAEVHTVPVIPFK